MLIASMVKINDMLNFAETYVMDGWIKVKEVLRIAYCNEKQSYSDSTFANVLTGV